MSSKEDDWRKGNMNFMFKQTQNTNTKIKGEEEIELYTVFSKTTESARKSSVF